uniref:Neural proliferation differentiation and control protein 1 n=1 Tax=Glossina brevipalpis TaxID=37001 RepID=A0A1A9WQS4_9MUSC
MLRLMGIISKTLVATVLILSILGHCEMSIYPGLRRKPLQQLQPAYEVNTDFLAQLKEENARRRLQQQYDQLLELINMQINRQRQRQERLRERFRQQQLAAMAADNSEEYSANFNDDYNNNNNKANELNEYDTTNPEFSYKISNWDIGNLKHRIEFAVGPADPRFYENEGIISELTEENSGTDIKNNNKVNDKDEDEEEGLDPKVLDEYEELPKIDHTDSEPNEMENINANNVALISQSAMPSEQMSINLHRIKPQSTTFKQNQIGLVPAHQDLSALIDKLHQNLEHSEKFNDENHLVVREHLNMKAEMGMYVVALIAGVSAAATVGLFVLGIVWYTFHSRSKAAADVEYPAYGVTGPNKDISPSGDRKLAQSAQMYHYQHQKQQIIAMENRSTAEESCEMSYVESDDDNEEGDYTVYECPGLAPTGEMEVKNPLFLDDTPVTPALGSQPIAQVTAQQPPVKKIYEKVPSSGIGNNIGKTTSMSSDGKKVKKTKK